VVADHQGGEYQGGVSKVRLLALRLKSTLSRLLRCTVRFRVGSMAALPTTLAAGLVYPTLLTTYRVAPIRQPWARGLNRSRGRVMRGLLGRGPKVENGRPCLDIDGFRQPLSRQEIIPITDQATGPLRRPRIKGLTIRTTVPNPSKATATLNVTRCAHVARAMRSCDLRAGVSVKTDAGKPQIPI
jgi:hypothetical protein